MECWVFDETGCGEFSLIESRRGACERARARANVCAQGGHFSLLALDTMDKVRSTKPPPKSILPSFDSSSQYPYLLALLGLVLVAVVGYRIYVRRRDAKGSYAELGQVSPMSPMSPFRPGKFRDEE